MALANRQSIPPLFVLFAVALVTCRCPADDFTIVKSLAFSAADPTLTLDLYLPQPQSSAAACVIVIQGGGFKPQNGQAFRPFAEHLARNEFAAALISYRGRPRHTYQDTLEDVKASVRFIRSVSKEHNLDPARIGATGRSAGGTLAALLAVTADDSDPDSQIQAAVCFAGVFDFVRRFTDPDQLALQPNRETKIKTNGEWIGSEFSPTDTDWLSASASQHVDDADPPILFLHSRDDSTVPWIQSRDMHRLLKTAGVESEIMIYETGGHSVRPKHRDSLDDMLAYFRKRLGP